MDDATSHTEIEAIIAHMEAATSHMVPVTFYTEAEISHTASATANTHTVTAYAEANCCG